MQKGINLGNKNGQWKGDEVKYGSLHDYIKSHLPKSDQCEICGRNGFVELANKSGLYLRDLSDWEWICRTCHMKKDGRLDRLHNDKLGKLHTEETRRKMSEAMTGEKHPRFGKTGDQSPNWGKHYIKKKKPEGENLNAEM